jgi:Xaa-Pro aminopeptidase
MNSSLKRAIKITRQIISRLNVKEGMTEKALADFIKTQLKKHGMKPAFRTIIASGYRSAKPHGFATMKKIKKGELVVIDFGALYNGYRTDVTRTLVAGRPNPKQKKLLAMVRIAQKKAIKLVRAGARCSEVDRAARGYIEAKGYGKLFIHTTGHGIGRRVHQAPKISRRNRHFLLTGQVVTVEPGIYIKGWGGVRIEDMVLVQTRGNKVLTR